MNQRESSEILLPTLRHKLQALFREAPISITSGSVVYKSFSRLYNRTIVVKIINKRLIEASIADKFLSRELDISIKVNHPHLARSLGLLHSPPSHIILVQEFYEGGNLLECLMREKRLEEVPIGCRYFRQLIEALNYLHGRKIAHRDVKLENIVVDGNRDIKLLDFGFARHIEKRERSYSFCGTRPYASSQVSRLQSYDPYAADYYAAGVVLYTMLVGKWPTYQEKNIEFPEKIPSIACKRLIVSLLTDDETHRAGYQECIHSEWMSNEPNWVFADKSFVYEEIRPKTQTKMDIE